MFDPSPTDAVPASTSPRAEPAREPLQVIGLSYRTASLALRSKVGIPSGQQPEAVRILLSAGIRECIILSTCNRTEIYFSGGLASVVIAFLADRANLTPEFLGEHLYAYSGIRAVSHMFRVAAGLDSAVLGETEILSQFKDAWRTASAQRAIHGALNIACRRTIEASKRVRTETEVCKGVTSVGTLAAREAGRFGSLLRKSVLIIGAGTIAERVAKELAYLGTGRFVIANRSLSKGLRLAEQYGGHAVSLDSLDRELAKADVVVAAISSEEPVLTPESIADATAANPERELLLIDLGVPRNIAPRCAELAGVRVVDIEGLAERCSENSRRREAALPHALEIVAQEVFKYEAEIARRESSGTIGALVEKGDEVRRRNLDWAMPKLAELGDRERKVVEDLATRIVRGMLETPIAELKDSLTLPHEREIAARLFGVDSEGGA